MPQALETAGPLRGAYMAVMPMYPAEYAQSHAEFLRQVTLDAALVDAIRRDYRTAIVFFNYSARRGGCRTFRRW
jgi:hypothetical protein